MKQLLLFMVLSLTSISVYSQKKVLDGVFNIRLGMSEKQLRTVVDTSYLKKNEEYTFWYKDCKPLEGRRKRLELESYIPEKGYGMKKIDLDFFDDKLYSIDIHKYNPQIEKLLNKKYGKPKKERKKETHIEYKTYAERTAEWDRVKSKTEKIQERKTWKTNDENIECYSFEDNSFYSLTIENKEIIEQIYHIFLKDEYGENALEILKMAEIEENKKEDKKEKKKREKKILEDF